MRPAFQPTYGSNLVRADDWRLLNKTFGFDLFLTLDADQIIENCVDVLGVDRRLVSRPHLVDLGLPLHHRQCRLIEDHGPLARGNSFWRGSLKLHGPTTLPVLDAPHRRVGRVRLFTLNDDLKESSSPH
jgi:hypothetical protein